MENNKVKSDRKETSFEIIINRLIKIESNHSSLSHRALEKTIRINRTEPQLCQNVEERPESIVNILHNIMDKMENNNLVLEQVVSELEESIM